MAREYRGNEASISDTFSLTSNGAATKLLLLLHLLCGWKITALDIKNAYLMVPQTETVLIKISGWMKKLAKIGEGISWLLKRCLPGQRAAAREWCEYFHNVLENFWICL